MKNFILRIVSALIFAVAFYIALSAEAPSTTRILGALVMAYVAGTIGAGHQSKLQPHENTGKLTDIK